VLLAWHDRAMTQLCMRGTLQPGLTEVCCRGPVCSESIKMPKTTPHPETPRAGVTPTRVAAIHLPELKPTPELPSRTAPACQQQPLVLSCPIAEQGGGPGCYGWPEAQ